MYYKGRDNGGGSSLKFGAEFWTDGRSVAKRLRALAGAGGVCGKGVSPPAKREIFCHFYAHDYVHFRGQNLHSLWPCLT